LQIIKQRRIIEPVKNYQMTDKQINLWVGTSSPLSWHIKAYR